MNTYYIVQVHRFLLNYIGQHWSWLVFISYTCFKYISTLLAMITMSVNALPVNPFYDTCLLQEPLSQSTLWVRQVRCGVKFCTWNFHSPINCSVDVDIVTWSRFISNIRRWMQHSWKKFLYSKVARLILIKRVNTCLLLSKDLRKKIISSWCLRQLKNVSVKSELQLCCNF